MSLPSPKDFYEKYKSNLDSAKNEARKIGLEMGVSFIQRLGSKGNDLKTVVAVLNEFQREVKGDPNAHVDGDRVTMRCTGFCPIMRVAVSLNISWEWLDMNLAIPMIEGIARSVIPSIVLRLVSAKSRGDPTCVYIFEVE
jgi:hypothetical protein